MILVEPFGCNYGGKIFSPLVSIEFELLIHIELFHHHVSIDDQQADRHYVFVSHESTYDEKKELRLVVIVELTRRSPSRP